MSEIKKKIKDLKNIISPYQKQLTDWYKKDKNAKKFIEIISPYKNKFYDFYKKNDRNKNIVIAGGVVLVLILGNSFLSGGSKWSNYEINEYKIGCQGADDPKSNYGKLKQKYCECSADYLSKRKKPEELVNDDAFKAYNSCKYLIKGKKAERAKMKDRRF